MTTNTVKKPPGPTLFERFKQGILNPCKRYVSDPSKTWKEKLWGVEKAYIFLPWTLVDKGLEKVLSKRKVEQYQEGKRFIAGGWANSHVISDAMLKSGTQTRLAPKAPIESTMQQWMSLDTRVDVSTLSVPARVWHSAKETAVHTVASTMEGVNDPKNRFAGVTTAMQSLTLFWDSYHSGNYVDLEDLLRKNGVVVAKPIHRLNPMEIQELQEKVEKKKIKLPRPLIELINERKADLLYQKVEEKKAQIEEVKQQLREIHRRLDKPFELWTNEDADYVQKRLEEKGVALPCPILHLLYGNFSDFYHFLRDRKCLPEKPIEDWTPVEILEAHSQLKRKKVAITHLGSEVLLSELMANNFSAAKALVQRHQVVIWVPEEEMTVTQASQAFERLKERGIVLPVELTTSLMHRQKELTELLDVHEIYVHKDLEKMSCTNPGLFQGFASTLLEAPMNILKSAANMVLENPRNVVFFHRFPRWGLARVLQNADDLQHFSMMNDIQLQEGRVKLLERIKELELEMSDYEADYQRAIDLNLGIKGFAHNYRTIYNNIIYFSDLLINLVKKSDLFEPAKMKNSKDIDFVKAPSGADNAFWARIYFKHRKNRNFDWASAFCKYSLNREIKDAEDFKAFCEEHGVEASQFLPIYKAYRNSIGYPFAEKALELAGYYKADDTRSWPQRYLDLVHHHFLLVVPREQEVKARQATGQEPLSASSVPRNKVDFQGYWETDATMEFFHVSCLPTTFSYNWDKEVDAWAERAALFDSRFLTNRSFVKKTSYGVQAKARETKERNQQREAFLHSPVFLARTEWGRVYLEHKDNSDFDWAGYLCEHFVGIEVYDRESFISFCQQHWVAEAQYNTIVSDPHFKDEDLAHEALVLVGLIDEFDGRDWPQRFLDFIIFHRWDGKTMVIEWGNWIHSKAFTILPDPSQFSFGNSPIALQHLKAIGAFSDISFDQLDECFKHRTEMERVFHRVVDSIVPALVWSICSLLQLAIRVATAGTVFSVWVTVQLFDLLYNKLSEIRNTVFKPLWDIQAEIRSTIWEFTKVLTLEPLMHRILKRQFGDSSRFIDRVVYHSFSQVKFFGKNVALQVGKALDEILRALILSVTTIDHEFAAEQIVQENRASKPAWLAVYESNKDRADFNWVEQIQKEKGEDQVTTFSAFQKKYLRARSSKEIARFFLENYHHLLSNPDMAKVQNVATKSGLSYVLTPFVGPLVQDLVSNFDHYRFWDYEPDFSLRLTNQDQPIFDAIQEVATTLSPDLQKKLWAEFDLILSGKVDPADGLSWAQRYLYMKNPNHWLSHYMLHRFDSSYDWAAVYLEAKRKIRIRKATEFCSVCSTKMKEHPQFAAYIERYKEKRYTTTSWAEEFLDLENDHGIDSLTWVSLGNRSAREKFVILMSGSDKTWEEMLGEWVKARPANDLQLLIQKSFPKEMVQMVIKFIQGEEVSLVSLIQQAQQEMEKPGSRWFSGALANLEYLLKHLHKLQTQGVPEEVSVDETQAYFQHEYERIGLFKGMVAPMRTVKAMVTPSAMSNAYMNDIYWNGALYLGMGGIDQGLLPDQAPIGFFANIQNLIYSPPQIGSMADLVSTTSNVITSAAWLPITFPWTVAKAVVNPMNWIRLNWMIVQFAWYAPAMAFHFTEILTMAGFSTIDKRMPIPALIRETTRVQPGFTDF